MVIVEVGDFMDTSVLTIYNVDTFVIHEKYNRSDTPSFDIAMVKLNQSVRDESQFIAPCKYEVPHGVILGACGMGDTSRSRDQPRFPEALMETYFFHLSMPMNPFSPISSGSAVVSVDSFNQATNMCEQDDGSPLYTFYCQSLLPECLYGVMSYSVPNPDSPPDQHCNGRDYFASIPAVHLWIEATIVLGVPLNFP
ncbi:uncharacterized protein LOC142335055 [Convolutriloba macropyga]|uniref:uncharacterized protein LOC142335055 n=1 Tax=Convolutriloba macropyga TaxID=536237 RepID=UPI003F52435D